MNIINQLIEKIYNYGSVEIIDVEKALIFDMIVKNNELLVKNDDDKLVNDDKLISYIITYTLIQSLLNEKEICIDNDEKINMDEMTRKKILDYVYIKIISIMQNIHENDIIEAIVSSDKENIIKRLSLTIAQDIKPIDNYKILLKDIDEKYNYLKKLFQKAYKIFESLSDTARRIK